MADSFPIPEDAPVIITTFPSIECFDLHCPPLKYFLKKNKAKIIINAINMIDIKNKLKNNFQFNKKMFLFK